MRLAWLAAISQRPSCSAVNQYCHGASPNRLFCPTSPLCHVIPIVCWNIRSSCPPTCIHRMRRPYGSVRSLGMMCVFVRRKIGKT
ncbi:uncharacterized protein BDW43DRAFT_287336 [Aspergillus alliaceus]|uniref:uncharacterized protein n=1 Tax=Petromyces alliaceus TaxID=209559 RepID=UPI0012A3DB68|nr:uncharacterized protein BDW43DRAFT_287336 [Aspergillus alliaceus]KAB8229924.1 hypothetical protein BDW43DRAFT_287336 [Aspergillus alliaceus]